MSIRDEFIKHLEIAIGVLDRTEGTKIYQVQQQLEDWTDKDYSSMLDSFSILLLQLKNKSK